MIPKFRAWHKHFKVMKKVGQITFTEAVWDYQPEQQNDTVGVSIPYQPDYVLMQSTGMIDENKAEVFQDDIVWHDQNEDYGVVEIGEAKFVIRWQNGYIEDLFERIDLLEVVGNVHTHGHLLESGGDRG